MFQYRLLAVILQQVISKFPDVLGTALSVFLHPELQVMRFFLLLDSVVISNQSMVSTC